jgi:MtrB/PioB family decaheme-associated outer membrane protein
MSGGLIVKGVVFKWLGPLFVGLFVWPFCGIAGEDRFAEEQVLSGEASVILRDIDREGVSAKFEEYRDFNSVSGELELEYRNKDRHFFEIRADNIGEDDQYVGFLGGWYGKLKVGFSYDQVPHKFALGARTLYSGIGSGNLTLDDGLQTRLQAAPGTIDAEFSNNAVSGDPELSRDIVKLNVDVAAYDPFGLRVEVNREDREGTRPFFGSFGLSNTVEIFEPRDYQTTDVKVAAEYSKKQLFLSAGYNYSSFDNNIDTLTWDNPYRITDANLLGASKGSMDLAPDNQYHNFSVSGSYMDLPLKTRVSATASWGWMMQDDNLVPYTSNTDISTPALPKQNVDAEVNTSIYNFLFTSRPKDFLRIKGRVRHFEYDNKTEQIRFPGFVSADASYESTPIVNLPISYKKTKAELDLGFDLFTRTRLNLGYAFNQTKRTNRRLTDKMIT